ncbi:MAG TPA: hypothetical protein VGN07_09735 [Steroidobacteraceae bacterium]|jgi:hypothetical protein
MSVVESSIDTFRRDLRDWSGQYGGAVGASIGVFVSDHIGLVEGFASGAAHMATGTASLALAASDLVNPVTWALDGQRNIDHMVNAYRAVDAVDSIVDPNRWMTNPRQSLNNAKAVLAGLTKEYQKDFANGDVPKLAGRGTFEFLSAAGPLLLGKVGRLETLAKVGGEAPAGTQSVQDAATAGSHLEPDVANGVNRGSVPNTADALNAGADVRVSSRPQWLQRLDAGNDFNAERASAYPYNEVYVNKADGSGYYRLDSYDPAAGEIVSRKFTQLSDVQESTAVRYINEISAKYPVNGVVADVPSSGDLSGQLLRGQYYLEVPVQARPIPQSVLNAANRQGVLIRDINGKVY